MRIRAKRRTGVYSAAAGLPFDDEELESRLVWIWTTARSGSTWFLRLLAHPLRLVDASQDPDDLLAFRAPPTWQGRVDAIPVDTTFIANHLAPLPGNADYGEDWEPRTFAGTLGLNPRPNYFFSPKYADAWRPELRRLMLVRFNRLVERTGERYTVADPLVLLKEVAGGHAADLVMSLFPRSRMIYLIRDGRDVVDSQTAANRPGGWLPVKGYETPEERVEFVRRRSRTWVGDMKTIQRAFDAHPAELRRSVRYEDLLADTGGTVRPILDWLGLVRDERRLERAIEMNSFESVAPEIKGEGRFFRSATPGRWRENLTPEEQSIMQEVMAAELEALGYRLDDPEPGEGTPEAPSGEGGAGAAGGDDHDTARMVGRMVQANAAGRDFAGVSRLVRKRGGERSRRAHEVALTFDDGPVFRTAEILETLGGYGARATFFLVGRKIPGQEALVRRIAAGGHEIGNHSFGHASFPPRDDVTAASALIRDVVGSAPRIFRPPFGAIDTPGALAMTEQGMSVILWSVDSEDVIPPWIGIDAETVHRNVVDGVRPGSIVLMHDGQPWSSAADALPAILETLAERRYRTVTVSELLATEGARHGRTRLRRLAESRVLARARG